MDLNEYADAARATATYRGRGTETGLAYAALGLTGEAGEAADEVKKVIGRGEYTNGATNQFALAVPRSRHDKLVSELGDVLWYFVAMCDELGIDPDDVAERNIAKLRARQDAGTLLGGNRVGEVA